MSDSIPVYDLNSARVDLSSVISTDPEVTLAAERSAQEQADLAQEQAELTKKAEAIASKFNKKHEKNEEKNPLVGISAEKRKLIRCIIGFRDHERFRDFIAKLPICLDADLLAKYDEKRLADLLVIIKSETSNIRQGTMMEAMARCGVSYFETIARAIPDSSRFKPHLEGLTEALFTNDIVKDAIAELTIMQESKVYTTPWQRIAMEVVKTGGLVHYANSSARKAAAAHMPTTQGMTRMKDEFADLLRK